MRKNKINLRGQELGTRLTGILTAVDGISWKPPLDEQNKAQQLLIYLAGQRALHYPYDKEIGSFIVQAILDINERFACDIEALSTESLLRNILRAMQAACRKFWRKINLQAQVMGGHIWLNFTARWANYALYWVFTSSGLHLPMAWNWILVWKIYYLLSLKNSHNKILVGRVV